MKVQHPHTASTEAARSVTLLCALLLAAGVARAGPPYLTDDPDPVAHHHWEFYLASQWDPIGRRSASGSLPHVEVNFGFAEGAMVHVLVPAAITISPAGTRYGLGDLEVGANVRIVKETAHLPQIGTFPIAVLPTGSAARGLGSGAIDVFVPLWLMKHIGSWTFDGGGGIDLAADATEARLGTFAQRSFGKVVSVGAEAFVTVSLDTSRTRAQLNLALICDPSTSFHLLLSAGPSFGAVGGAQAYAAWLLTL